MIAKISAPILMRAFSETEDRRREIQGFYIESTGEHYVMDFTLERGQQQRWTGHGLEWSRFANGWWKIRPLRP